jgi:four helix bundle protein
MDSYRASKAWHLGRELAREVQAVVKLLPEDGSNLPGYMRRSSVAVPLHIASSVSKKLHEERLECYVQAREAAIQLQEHLSLARDMKYIEKQAFDTMAAKAIETQNILTILIRKVSYEMAQAKE